MIVELGKYYKTRDGITMGPMVVNKDDYAYPFRCKTHGKSYAPSGCYYKFDEDPLDLIEECNADGSPIVPEPPASLSWNVPVDRSWRDEIALRVLPALVGLGTDLKDKDMPNATQADIVVSQAFYIADVFLKAAKQS